MGEPEVFWFSTSKVRTFQKDQDFSVRCIKFVHRTEKLHPLITVLREHFLLVTTQKYAGLSQTMDLHGRVPNNLGARTPPLVLGACLNHEKPAAPYMGYHAKFGRCSIHRGPKMGSAGAPPY